MKNQREKQELIAKLTRLRLEEKMCRWVFLNNTDAPKKEMDAILDRKNQIERAIKFCEERLKEL